MVVKLHVLVCDMEEKVQDSAKKVSQDLPSAKHTQPMPVF
jgi:hypothetical protein